MSNYHKAETILKVEDVSLKLGDNQILKDLNVEIKNIVRPGVTQGQIVGFLGPSGIGKTKFFEILAGLRQPDTGKVLLGEKLEPVKAGTVGVVQQSYPLFNYRTVMGNLEIAAKKGGVASGEVKDKVNHFLDRFGLRKQANQYPAELSGGQRQRVAIAQQLLCSEHFLLLDEPFSGLDVLMIEKVSEMLCDISCEHEHNTIIIVSHDIVSTAAISDTIWLMGREYDKDKNPIAGSKIKHTYDLMEKGLAWKPDITENREFKDLIDDIRKVYHQL
jgi:ABC-type nitrate/sulfonate/bicarbonate transport system ATPase subunit